MPVLGWSGSGCGPPPVLHAPTTCLVIGALGGTPDILGLCLSLSPIPLLLAGDDGVLLHVGKEGGCAVRLLFPGLR